MAADQNTRVLCVHWVPPPPREDDIREVATLTQTVLEYMKKLIKTEEDHMYSLLRKWAGCLWQ